MAKSKPEPWFQDAASLMVRDGLTLRQAVSELGLPGITTDDCERIERRVTFQRILRAERFRLGQEVASDPNNTKEAAIGLMTHLVIKLIEGGEYDRALEGLMKVAKVAGWMGVEWTVNIFGGLTTKDIEEQKQRILERLALNKEVPIN